MKILNLYAGIGGNRKHWDGDKHDITAVEWDEEIAQVYRDHFPEDEVIVADAHEYLKENYADFDFIWASPPCPTHSRIRNEVGVGKGQYDAVYPDMELYEEIIFLQRVSRPSGNFDGEYVVENVISDYDPLIRPQKIQRHYFWASFTIPSIQLEKDNINGSSVEELEERHGYDLSGYDIKHGKKRKMLRNCTHPELGKKILNSMNKQQEISNF